MYEDIRIGFRNSGSLLSFVVSGLRIGDGAKHLYFLPDTLRTVALELVRFYQH